jgi:hypothetical protein
MVDFNSENTENLSPSYRREKKRGFSRSTGENTRIRNLFYPVVSAWPSIVSLYSKL